MLCADSVSVEEECYAGHPRRFHAAYRSGRTPISTSPRNSIFAGFVIRDNREAAIRTVEMRHRLEAATPSRSVSRAADTR